MSARAARYAPSHAFPAYAFLPGRDPHPSRDPLGHSYGIDEVVPLYLPPERWRENDAYLWGVDLYNHGFLWESHEAWEGLWHVSKHDADQADHLQGLIQCAAACLKVSMGQATGLARLSELGLTRLERVARANPHRYMGLDLERHIVAMRAFAASKPVSIEGRPLLELS